MTSLKRFVGPKDFYKMVFAVAVPIMIQNGITNFVSLLDNLMVGRMGTEQMSGVAIANQLLFVFNLCIFGGLSGAGIFTAQFHGSRDTRGVRDTFRFKLITAAIVLIIGLCLCIFFGEDLIRLYLKGEEDVGNIDATAAYGLSYLRVMLVGLVPFCLMQTFAGTLRETGETVLPMKASIVSVLTNLVLNYLLIFGKLGLPALGVVGAAIATVVARFIELTIVLIGTYKNTDRHGFIVGAFRSLKIPAALTKNIIVRGMPLLANELLWSVGMAFLTQCYSARGLSVVAAQNISSTISNFFNIVFMALGSAVAILVGQQLGAAKYDEAKTTASRLMAFSVACCFVIGGLLAIAAPLIPQLYKTTDEVRNLATNFLWICAGCMPIFSFAHCCYFTLRSGGKTLITFIFDCAYVWIVVIPLVYTLVHHTDLTITQIFFCGQFVDIVKCIIGGWMVKKGIWINRIVTESSKETV